MLRQCIQDILGYGTQTKHGIRHTDLWIMGHKHRVCRYTRFSFRHLLRCCIWTSNYLVSKFVLKHNFNLGEYFHHACCWCMLLWVVSRSGVDKYFCSRAILPVVRDRCSLICLCDVDEKEWQTFRQKLCDRIF